MKVILDGQGRAAGRFGRVWGAGNRRAVCPFVNHPNWSNLSANALRLDNASDRAQITGAAGATSGSAGDAAGPRVLRLDLRIDF